MAVIMLLARYASDNPRLSTIVTVSLEKQRVSACTCLVAGCLSRPDRLKYAAHCDFHALKSVLQSTCRSSLGRSPSLNMYVARFDGCAM